jgi:hypothetical protein
VTCQNKCCYCIVNIYTRLTQFERVNSELKRISYDFPKTVGVWYENNQVINFNLVVMLKQSYQLINIVNMNFMKPIFFTISEFPKSSGPQTKLTESSGLKLQIPGHGCNYLTLCAGGGFI